MNRMWETNGNDIIWMLFSCGRWQQLHTTSVGGCFPLFTYCLINHLYTFFLIRKAFLWTYHHFLNYYYYYSVFRPVNCWHTSEWYHGLCKGQAISFSLSLSPHSWTHEKEIVEVSLCSNSTSVFAFYFSCKKLSQPDDPKKSKMGRKFSHKFLCAL
jgi:hypothetical protein